MGRGHDMDFTRSISHHFAKFLSVSLVLSLGLQALAEPSRNIAAVQGERQAAIFPNPSGFQAITSGRDLSQKDVIFRTLLSAKGKDLDWPGFPRAWHEQSQSEFLTSNTALGLSASGLGYTASIDYKYSLKTALVIIASNRPADNLNANNPGEIAAQAIENPLEFEIFRYDPATHRSLPNVRPGYPMVAFCAFEASLNYTTSQKGGLTFVGSGQTVESGTLHTVSHSLFSRFLQVDGTSSPTEMLDQVCKAQFRKQVEQYVKRDFSRAVSEVMAYSGPANECQEDTKRDGENGDAQCMGWFERLPLAAGIKAHTVPRCLLTRSGVHRCAVAHKADGNCPMVMEKSTGRTISPELKVFGENYTQATNGAYEFTCDKKRGLSCKVIQAPKALFNVPWWDGVARCARD